MTATLIRRSDGDRLTLDAVPEAEVAPSWRVTEHPIEADAYELSSVVDHVQRLAGRITLRAIVSERPPSDVSDHGGPDRIREVLAWLDAAGGEPLDVAFPFRPTLRSYVLEGAPWRVDVAEHVELRLTLREVRLAETQTTTAPQAIKRPAPAIKAGSQTTKDTGAQSTEPATTTQSKSVLKMLSGLVGG